MPPIHDTAICIRHWDWSETSQTVSLFTRAHGLVRAIAKGAKRPGAPFSGGLELLTVGDAGLVIKPSTELALLTEWDLTEVFPSLRTDLARQYNAMYAAELLQRMVTDRDPHPELFDAALQLLRALESGESEPALLRFQLAALSTTGYRPVLDRDVRTGSPLALSGTLAFSPSLGGVTSAPTTPEAGTDDDSLWLVRAGTIRAIVETEKPHETPGSAAERSQDVPRANRLLAAYIRHLLGAEPATLRLVFPDLASKPGQSRGRA